MTEKHVGRWEQIRAQRLATPDARERYEQTRQAVLQTRQLLQLIDAEREKVGMTKAELAARVGTNPAALRRLLTSESGNPTLRTLISIADVLGLEVSITAKGRPQDSREMPALRTRASGSGAK
jgi:DNA-binding phage protein